MSHHDEKDVVISGESAMKKLEQLCDVLELKWILLATGAGMLFYAIILIGIFTAINARDLPTAAPSDWVPPPTPEPAVEYVEEPAQITIETVDESLYTSAHDIGVQAGELFLNSRDTIIDFWNGFDETTGASDWARVHWDSGRERMSGWIEENFPPDDCTEEESPPT